MQTGNAGSSYSENLGIGRVEGKITIVLSLTQKALSRPAM